VHEKQKQLQADDTGPCSYEVEPCEELSGISAMSRTHAASNYRICVRNTARKTVGSFMLVSISTQTNAKSSVHHTTLERYYNAKKFYISKIKKRKCCTWWDLHFGVLFGNVESRNQPQ
jgi:hypothetical protein